MKKVCAAYTKPALIIPHDIETLKKCLHPLTRIHEQRYRYLVEGTPLEMELLPNTKLLFKCGAEPSWKDDLTQLVSLSDHFSLPLFHKSLLLADLGIKSPKDLSVVW